MPTLFIRALSIPQKSGEGLDFSCEWLVVDADGRHHAHGSGDFACGSDGAEGTRPFPDQLNLAVGQADNAEGNDAWACNPANVVVFAPGEHVLSISCEVPGRSIAQIRRALPYVVEEFIAGAIERSHLASGPVKRGQPVRCCIVEDDLVQDWLACLAALGIRPGHLVSEADLLPVEPREASVLIENGSALLRTEDQAATIDRGNLLPALMSLDVNRLTLINGALTDIEASQLEIDVETRAPGALQKPGAVLDYLADRWRQSHCALNLLQGAYAPESPGRADSAKWRSVGLLAAAWLVLVFLGMVATGIWSSIQADSLESESLALYRSIFPQDRTATVQNIRRRMQARLGERPDVTGKSMVAYTGDLAAVMGPSMTLLGIDYHQARGEFATELLVKRYDDVDRVREALAARGIDAEITSAEQVDQGVQARLRLRGG